MKEVKPVGSFPAGISTDEEVARLMQLNLQPGEIVPYGRIAALAGAHAGSHRFRTVVSAWTRRVFREQRMQYSTVRSVGLRFLTEAQALEKGIGDTKRSARAERRVATRVKSINSRQLTPTEQRQHQLLGQYLRARDSAARLSARELAMPLPTATVVRIAR